MDNESTDDASVVAIQLQRDANVQTVLDEIYKVLPPAEDST